MTNKKEWYEKFRWFFTSNDFLVIGGKNSEQNEQIIKNHLDAQDIILHTKAPGSPFCIIKKKLKKKKISSKDIKETAIFCACFSQQWKKKKAKGKKKNQIEVHIFKSSQIFKEKKEKTGTFNVLGNVNKVFVKPELWLGKQKDKLRAVPKSCLKKPLIKIMPGKITKEKVINKIKDRLKGKFEKDEIASAIPSGGFKLGK